MDPQQPPSQNSTVESGEIIINMESMIKSHISSIDRLAGEIKKHKQMLYDIFANDPTFQAHDKEAKQASKVKATTRAQILKRPQAADLQNQIKGMQSEASQLKGALSDYLQEYQRLSGVNQIEGDDGEVREIVYIAKLVKKSFRP